MSGPDVWGPHGWKFIHYITLGYPSNPTKEDKSKYANFFNSLQYVIPCSICGAHFRENLKNNPINDNILSSKVKLIEWGINIHNLVNKSNNKKQYTYEEGLNEILMNSKDKCVIDNPETFADTEITNPNCYKKIGFIISVLVNIILIVIILLIINKFYL
jgi:hypothetical protein